MSDKIYFSPPVVDEADIQAVTDALKGGWIAPVGPEINAFETALKEKYHFLNVLALNSGTSALHLAVKLAGVGKGDQVLVASFGYVAAANAVLYEGGIPVFVDSTRESWNMSPDLLEQYLENVSVLPRAVIFTDIFGLTGSLEQVSKICKKYGVTLIEDAAEAIGSRSGDHFAGNLGDYAALSFNGNKLITTGGGGALVCREASDYQKALFWATQSKENEDHFHHSGIGYNYRLSNVLAALGKSQLGRIDEVIEKKKQIKSYYRTHLAALDWIVFPKLSEQGWNHWVIPFLIKEEYLDKVTPSQIVEKMEQANIEIKRFWKPLHLQPYLTQFEELSNGVAESLFHQGFCLPCGAGISEAEMNRVHQSDEKYLVGRRLTK